jgi:hypothetical protein
MPNVQEFNFAYQNSSAGRSSCQEIVCTAHDVPLERVLIERVDSSADSTDLRGKPSLKRWLIICVVLAHEGLPRFAR